MIETNRVEFQGQYNLGDTIKNEMSCEKGVIVGRAEYLYNEPTYLVRHVGTWGGSFKEEWWPESVIEDCRED